jgi:hypothetical protein
MQFKANQLYQQHNQQEQHQYNQQQQPHLPQDNPQQGQ